MFGLKSSAIARHIVTGKVEFSYPMLAGLFEACKFTKKEKMYIEIMAAISKKATPKIRAAILKAFL